MSIAELNNHTKVELHSMIIDKLCEIRHPLCITELAGQQVQIYLHKGRLRIKCLNKDTLVNSCDKNVLVQIVNNMYNEKY